MTVLTISRQFGAGGKTLGKTIATRLGYTLADEDLVQMVAERAKVSNNWVKSIEKEAGGSLLRFMDYMISKSYVDRVLAETKGYIDEKIYVNALSEIISTMADEGDCVIVGRGGQYILRDHPRAFHILLVARREDRVRFMMENYNLTRKQAETTITVQGKRRRALYKKFGKEDYDHPSLYDLVLNMSRISMEKAVDLTYDLIRG